MKALSEFLRNLPVLTDKIPPAIVWAVIIGHYGLHFIIVLLYIISWICWHGDRAELLLLLEKI